MATPVPAPTPRISPEHPTSEELQAAAARLRTLTASDVYAMDEYVTGCELEIEKLKLEISALREVIAVVADAIGPAHAWSHFQHEGTREEISLGVRGRNMDEVAAAFFDSVKHIKEEYGVVLTGSVQTGTEPTAATSMPASVTTVSAPQPAPARPPAPPNEPQYVPVGAETPAPASAQDEHWEHGKEYQYICYRVRITPKANGVTQVEMFGRTRRASGDQYALVTYSRKPANLVTTFSPVWVVDESYFEKAQDVPLSIPFVVRWKLSDERTTSSGQPYKDLVAVEPVPSH